MGQTTPVKSNKSSKIPLKSNEALLKLVDELMKEQPNEVAVRELTTKLGLPYSADSATQMSTVLQSMNSVSLKKAVDTDLEVN